MTEKQFRLSKYVTPTSTSYFYNQQGQMLNKEVASMLNKLYDENVQLKEKNEQLKEENKKLIEEWEFSFRTEMAHHRFAEKELQEKIRKKQARIKELEKENEQLRKELDSFHPVMFQDMRYGTVTLYSKGGIDE